MIRATSNLTDKGNTYFVLYSNMNIKSFIDLFIIINRNQIMAYSMLN